MVETDIDEYKLDTNQGKKHLTLRVSLKNNRVCMIIKNLDNPKDKFTNYVRLEQFRNACEAFDNIKTIMEALILIKTTIEEGRILLSEDEESRTIDIKFNVRLGKKEYPPFVIGLPFEAEVVNKNQTQNVNKKQNDVEVLPTTFDYLGDAEAEAKYGKTTKNTTEYANPIIKSNVKEPQLVLELIEPILQVHYPDGTTKSTALPPRLQTADGKKPNINPEQLKTLHEQMAKSFNQSVSEYEKENNRSNSVTNRNQSNYSRQTVNGIGNTNNVFRQVNSNEINYQNNNSNNNNLNIVRSAMKPQINMNTFNSNNLNENIRATKTSFNTYDNERESDISNNMAPRDNYKRQKKNNKVASDYAISSLPNKPLVIPNYYSTIPNPTIKNNPNINFSQSSNNSEQSPIIQEVPRFITQSQNSAFNLNPDFYQRGLNKSSSSPNFVTLDKVNHNFYQQNQAQTQYSFPQNQNQSFIQNQINNINLNLRYPIPYPHQQNQNIQNYQNKINQTHNPNYNRNNQLLNLSQNVNQQQQQQQIQTNTLTRNNSSRVPVVSQSYIAQMNQQQLIQQKLLQQKMLQQRIQEQQKLLQQTLQEQKKLAIPRSKDKQKLQEQKKTQMMKISQQKNIPFPTQMSQQINKKNINPMTQRYENSYLENNQISQKGQQLNPISQSQVLRNQQSQPVKYQQKISQPIEISRNQENEVHPKLKQSFSQQIIKKKPSFKNEITKQQIALAQMASLQNLQNPTNVMATTVSLDQRFLDREGNEETQSQYEREDNDSQIQEIQEQKRNLQEQKKNLQPPVKKKEQKKEQKREQKQEQQQEQEQTQEQTAVNEADIFENLYRTEEGLIIFRNGLLHGIIHKFAEITDVVSKIQIMLSAGVKFFLLYRASEHGDKAKTFHEKCDNHKMTFVLVETTKGRRFGGFTTKSWDGNCVKKVDNDAFVFSIDKNKCYDVIKNEFAVGGYPKFGPVFFGCQIRIYDEFFKKGGTTCYKQLNYKTREDYELNGGEKTYIVKEIEVYEVEVIKMV